MQADRLFLKDFWNAQNIGKFWSLYNKPVHEWFVRHVYLPLMGIKGIRNEVAGLCVFLLSGFMHDYVYFAASGRFTCWSFLSLASSGIFAATEGYLRNR